MTRVATADTRHVAELDGHVSGSGPYRAGPARAGARRQVAIDSACHKIILLPYLFFTSHYILESLNNRGRGREAAVDKRGGVIYKKEQIQNMLELAAELGVQPPTILDREKSGL